jgi:hypothetical protein
LDSLTWKTAAEHTVVGSIQAVAVRSDGGEVAAAIMSHGRGPAVVTGPTPTWRPIGTGHHILSAARSRAPIVGGRAVAYDGSGRLHTLLQQSGGEVQWWRIAGDQADAMGSLPSDAAQDLVAWGDTVAILGTGLSLRSADTGAVFAEIQGTGATGPGAPIRAAPVRTPGELWVYGRTAGCVEQLDPAHPGVAPARTFAAPTPIGRSLSVSASGRYLAICGTRGTRVFDTTSDTRLHPVMFSDRGSPTPVLFRGDDYLITWVGGPFLLPTGAASIGEATRGEPRMLDRGVVAAMSADTVLVGDRGGTLIVGRISEAS